MLSTDDFKQQQSGIASSADMPQPSILKKRNGPSASRSTRNETSRANQFRKTLTTNDAANALNRKPQTLRKWACLESGPIRPVRIHGRLAWYADEIAALLDQGSQ